MYIFLPFFVSVFERFYFKISKSFLKVFGRGDNWHNLNYQTGDLGYGFLHYALIRVLKPQRVLAIGSRYGLIPAVCALACKHNRKGMVDFVDANYDVTDKELNVKSWGGYGFWNTTESRKHFALFGLEKYIQFHIMTTKAFREKFSKRTWSYIYIDGDHSYDGVKLDFKLFSSSLKSGGLIVFHDLFSKDSKQFVYGVKRLWREIAKTKQYQMISILGNFGLGIIQKKS